MLIVSQNRLSVINLDNSIGFTTTLIGNGEGYHVCAKLVNGETGRIATYESVDRAKEVLMEIVRAYQDCNANYKGIPYVKNVAYQMPEE